MNHYTVKVGPHIVYSGIGFVRANEIMSLCKNDPTFKCTLCTAKEFFIPKDTDVETALSDITKNMSCADMSLKCVGKMYNGNHLYQCNGNPKDIGEVSMVCENK